MRVLSNTSPLMNLAAIGRQDLLHELFGEVLATPAVLAELEAGGAGAPAADARRWPWLSLYSPQNADTVRVLTLQLDRGEAETLAAALETKSDLVLLDEKLGRRAAANLGVAVLGTIGVLLAAKRKGLLPALRPALDDLRHKAGFWISDAVYQQALVLAEESTQ
jgi:predicted nucleic acid-binding protein